MNPLSKERKMSIETRRGNKDTLLNIDATLKEISIYLVANPDDNIALAQYQQFIAKREALVHALIDIYDDLPDCKMLA